MRVALDATPLTLSSGGIARYVRELSRALAIEFAEEDILLVSDQPFVQHPAAPPNLRSGRAPSHWLEKRWWLYGVLQEAFRTEIDVFHGTHFVVPWLPLRATVTTLHDLSPWLNQAWHRKAGFVRGRAPYMLGLGLATMAITPTEAVRREAIAHFGLHPERIRAVPLAASDSFRPTSSAPSETPYFLYLGALEPRKNLDMLIQAWRCVRTEHCVDLWLGGRAQSDFCRPAPEPGLKLLGEISDQDLPSLYSSAVAVLYPSLYEGFGLPVLEAMQCAALVIASRDPAVMEVAADGAILLEARDVAAWVTVMREAVTRPENLAPYRASALRRAKLFSWGKTARLTRAVYAEAVERFEG